MDNGAASAFVYAKACGMISKSFAGDNLAKLFSVKSLAELYTLLFNEEVPSIPISLLTKQIEYKAEQKFFADYIKLLSCYSKPYKIFSELFKFYDYENLKEIGSLLAMGENEKKDFSIPKKFSVLNYDKWPNLNLITKNSCVSWYNKVVSVDELQEVDNKLDIQYIHEIWNAANELPSSIKDDVMSLLKDEVVMKNVLWALRLKVYYKMSGEEIAPRLAYEHFKPCKCDVFANDALAILEKDVENYGEWQDWKYAKFLNPHIEGELWSVDPTWVERSWKSNFNKKIARLFHKQPLSPLVLISFFKLKQNELDCITTVAEGLRLDIGQEAMLEAAGYSMEQR